MCKPEYLVKATAIIAGHDVRKRLSVYVHKAYLLIQSLMVHKKRGFKQIPTDKVCLNYHLFLDVGYFGWTSDSLFFYFYGRTLNMF